MSPRADLTGATLAFAFPGVGVRPCGQERAFYERNLATMAPLLGLACDRAGVDLLVGLDEGAPPLGELEGQLLTYAFNCAVAAACRGRGLAPSFVAGHSLGIYSALAAAEVIDFAEGLEIVELAYRIVAGASAGSDGTMAVVVGLGRAEVEALLASLPPGDSTRLVNSNNDTTKVFSGRRGDLEALVEEARRREALKARLLPVGSPYHHPDLLAGASLTFAEELRRFRWSRATCPVISSIDQRPLVEAEELLDLTARNIATPIDWERVVGALGEAGVDLIVECGAGLSLTQNGRLIPGCPPFVNVKNAERRAGL